MELAEKVDETLERRGLLTCAAQHLTQPHMSSYFLPGNAADQT